MTREKTNSHHFDHHIKEIRDGHKLPAIILTGLAAAAAIGIASTDNEPTPQSKTFAQESTQKTYEQAVSDSAQVPLDRETETPVIDNIVVPDGMIPTEYIPSEPRIVEYVIDNKDEASAVKTSINSVKTVETNTYALVKRDVDNDGDTDAVITQVIEK